MRGRTTVLTLLLAAGLAMAASPSTDITAPAGLLSITKMAGPSEPSGSGVFDSETLHYDGPNDNAIGLTAGGQFRVAARFTPASACTLTSVIHYHNDPELSNQYIVVYGPGTATTPGAAIDSVPYPAADTGWREVMWPGGLALPGGSDFWVSIWHNHSAGMFPAGIDAGPMVRDRGGFIQSDVIGPTWQQIGDLGFDGNWNIRAVIGGGGGPGHDVGATMVVAPIGMIPPDPIAPVARIYNFGGSAESDIPVYCWVDSAGTRVYTQNVTHAGPLSPGASADVAFPTWSGVDGNTYQVTMFTMLGGDENNANDTIDGSVTVTAANWIPVTPPADSVDKLVHATVYDPVGDKIYVIGGNPEGNAASYHGMCQVYDPLTDGWTNLASQPTPRGWAPGSYCRGKIYYIGGHNNAGTWVATNEAYSIEDNSWSTVTARPRAALAASEVVWRDSLVYVMGGLASSALSNVDIYDPSTDGWMVGTALPAASYMGTAAIIGDTIFIAQAYNGSTCWSNFYKGAINPANPTEITWIQGAALTEPVFNGGTVALNGDVYWLGGYVNALTATDHVWKYSTATGQITQFDPSYPVTLTRISFMAARPVTDGGEIYVMAGDQFGDWSRPNQAYHKIQIGGVGVEEQRPVVYSRLDATPTLVRDFARVSYSVSRSARVDLGVYDASGKQVRTLAGGTVAPGEYSVTWNRTDDNGRTVANGTYFYRLVVDGRTVSSKAVVLN